MLKNVILVAALLASSFITAQEIIYQSPTNDFSVSKITDSTYTVNFPVDVLVGYKTIVADEATVLNVVKGIEQIYSDDSFKKGGQLIIDGWVISRFKKTVTVQPWASLR